MFLGGRVRSLSGILVWFRVKSRVIGGRERRYPIVYFVYFFYVWLMSRTIADLKCYPHVSSVCFTYARARARIWPLLLQQVDRTFCCP